MKSRHISFVILLGHLLKMPRFSFHFNQFVHCPELSKTDNPTVKNDAPKHLVDDEQWQTARRSRLAKLDRKANQDAPSIVKPLVTPTLSKKPVNSFAVKYVRTRKNGKTIIKAYDASGRRIDNHDMATFEKHCQQAKNVSKHTAKQNKAARKATGGFQKKTAILNSNKNVQNAGSFSGNYPRWEAPKKTL